MEESNTNIEKVYNHWILRSDQDFETMINLYKTKDYHWALFMGSFSNRKIVKS